MTAKNTTKDLIRNGYRLNVGMVIANQQNRLFWGCRQISREAWQFPQGGVLQGESLRQALYREMLEEVGLLKHDVRCLAKTRNWYKYDIPPAYQRADRAPCIGQQQRWFLLRLVTHDSAINLHNSVEPEFETWRWVDYWEAVDKVASFKRDIYEAVLNEFALVLGIPPRVGES